LKYTRKLANFLFLNRHSGFVHADSAAMIWAWRGLRSAAVDDQNEWWSGKVCLHQRGFGFAVDESNK
jgi:hypothetical protein